MEDSWEWLQAGHLSAARPEAEQQESARALGRDCPLLQGTESGGAQGDWKVEIITLYIFMICRTRLEGSHDNGVEFLTFTAEPVK